jgi:hypothetical protein
MSLAPNDSAKPHSLSVARAIAAVAFAVVVLVSAASRDFVRAGAWAVIGFLLVGFYPSSAARAERRGVRLLAWGLASVAALLALWTLAVAWRGGRG